MIMEIRQGIGGLESIEFVKDIFNMYTKYFIKKNINYKILINNNYKEIIIEILDNNLKDFLIEESGIHRVQRIPKSENQGRIHTSTCSVVVIDIEINNSVFLNKDIKIETCRSSGSGGQHVNNTNSSVKITHLPTNITVECSDERSQFLNKNKALIILKFKIIKSNFNNYNNELNLIRKKIISNSLRSKKIRTYNFHNKKIIDHIKLKTYFQFYEILNGNLDFIKN